MKVKGESVLSKKKTSALPTSKILKPKKFKTSIKQTNTNLLSKEKLQLASTNEDLILKSIIEPKKKGKLLKNNDEPGSIIKDKLTKKDPTETGAKVKSKPLNGNLETPSNKKGKKENNKSSNIKSSLSITESSFKKTKKNQTSEPSVKQSSESVLNLKKVKDAVTGLLKISENSTKESKLLNLDQPVFLQVECIKIPICQKKQLRFTLPHPMINELSDVLLITADKKGSKIYPDKAVEHYTELLEKNDIKFIQKVLPLRSLRQEYSQYEMRRKLVDQYDMILADAKIMKMLPSLLGKLILYTRKMPIPVQLDRTGLKQHLQTALRKTQMTVKSNGNISMVQVGHTGMSAAHIAANITTVAQSLTEVYPGGWINVRSLKIKTTSTNALPVYLSLRSPNDVRIPVETKQRPDPVEGELSTMPGTNVIVRSDGTVVLKKVKEEKLIDDSHDAEILEEAQKYLQSSKTIRYDDSDEEASDKEADAITEAVEKRFMDSYRTKKAKQGEESGDEDEEEEEEESDEEEADVQLPIPGKKRKKSDAKDKSTGKSPNKKLKGSQPGQKDDGKKTKQGKGNNTPTKGNKENQRRGSRGGKKNKMNKDQRKAMIKRNKAGKK